MRLIRHWAIAAVAGLTMVSFAPMATADPQEGKKGKIKEKIKEKKEQIKDKKEQIKDKKEKFKEKHQERKDKRDELKATRDEKRAEHKELKEKEAAGTLSDEEKEQLASMEKRHDELKAKHDELKKRHQERKKDRKERRLEAKKKVLKNHPNILKHPKAVAEFKKHARRMVHLTRAKEVAEAEEREDVVSQLDELIAKEKARHQAWVEKHGDGK